MYPLLSLISSIISLYDLALIVWIVLGWLIRFNIVNHSQYVVYRVMSFLTQIIEPVLVQIRKIIPIISGVDLAPLVLFLLIEFLQNMIRY